jgi:hypothetical protein
VSYGLTTAYVERVVFSCGGSEAAFNIENIDAVGALNGRGVTTPMRAALFSMLPRILQPTNSMNASRYFGWLPADLHSELRVDSPTIILSKLFGCNGVTEELRELLATLVRAVTHAGALVVAAKSSSLPATFCFREGGLLCRVGAVPPSF